MKEKDPIADLFKQALENHEVPVRPGMWQQISRKLDTGSSSGPDGPSTVQQATKAGTKFLGGTGSWIAGGIITITGIAAVVWISTQSPTESTQIATQATVTENIQKVQSNQDIEQPELITKETQNPGNLDSQKETTNTNHFSAEKETGNNSSDHHVIPTPPVSTSTGINQAESGKNVTPAVQKSSTPDKSVTESNSVQKTAETGNSIPASSQNSANTVEMKISGYPLTGKVPLAVSFSASGSYGDVAWNFDDGSAIGKGASTNHLFRQPGTYMVTCQSIDGTGKISTQSIEIKALPMCDIENIPNVFTPNGDGSNDTFTIPVPENTSLEISIFDKSGKLIFKSARGENSWNGKISGQEDAPEGTYFYVIFASCSSGGNQQKKGTVTLIR